MKDNKKLTRLVVGLVCLIMCSMLLMTSCKPAGQSNPTVPEIPETTEPAEQTTQEETTEPNEETTEETTEEETTEAPTESSGSSKPGGSYQPQTTEPDPTEPTQEETTPVEVPAAGSEQNGYYEQFDAAPADFTTVKIPAATTMYYTVKTPGATMIVESAEACVIYDGKTFEPVDGKVQIPLPDGETARLQMQFMNKGAQEQAFAVKIMEAPGAKSNPLLAQELNQLAVTLAENDKDGLYYCWTATEAGILSVKPEGVQPAGAVVELVVTVNGKTAKLSESRNGAVEIAVEKDDPILVQVIAEADASGNQTALQTTLSSSIIAVMDLKIQGVPYTAKTVAVPAGGNAFYNISGANGSVLTVQDKDICVVYNGTTYQPDAAGTVTVKLNFGPDTQVAQIEIVNNGSQEKSCSLNFGHRLGDQNNPEPLTQIADLKTAIEAGSQGYYYTYTATQAGVAVFKVTENSAPEGYRTDIVLENKTTGVSESLWAVDASGTNVQRNSVSMALAAGDELSVSVSVVNPLTADSGCVEASLTIGIAIEEYLDLPYPGMDAVVPGNGVAYYQGTGLAGAIFEVHSQTVSVIHNGVTYKPQDGMIRFKVVSEKDSPAYFVVKNTGAEEETYSLLLSCHVGHPLRPNELTLGNSTVNQTENAVDYCFSYVAPKAGQVVFSFDPETNWCYAVENVNQNFKGEYKYSDSADASKTAVDVLPGDVIRILVNTYDPENPGVTPEGTVSFTASLITAIVEIEDLTKPYQAELLRRETAQFTGDLQGAIVSVKDALNATLTYNGVTHSANAKGIIEVAITEPNADGKYIFAINNNADDMTYTLSFSGVKGSWLSPDSIVLGTNFTNQQAGAGEYYYRYTAPKSGDLILTFEENTNWYYILNEGEKVYSDAEGVSNVVTVPVQSGDQVNLRVNTYDPAQPDTAPEGKVTFHALLITEPVEIADLTQPLDMMLLAGETAQYTGQLRNAILTLEDAGTLILTYNGTEYLADAEGILSVTFLEPDTDGNYQFTIHNTGAPKTYTVEFDGVEGSWLHPAQLIVDENKVQQAAGAEDYHYTFTAPKAGTLTVAFDEAANWSYTIDNLTKEVFGQTQYSNSDPKVSETSLTVDAGDEIQLRVNSFDPENPEVTPEGEIKLNVKFVTGPTPIVDVKEPVKAEMFAGETAVYTGSFYGETLLIANAQNLTVSYNGVDYTADAAGVITLVFPAAGEGTAMFAMRNSVEADAVYTITFSNDSGTAAKPAELKLGINTAICGTDGLGYYFVYTPDTAGTLTINFSGRENWYMKYGSRTYNSTKNPDMVLPINVNASKVGVPITLIIKVYDPENPTDFPAGTVEFEASYTPQ